MLEIKKTMKLCELGKMDARSLRKGRDGEKEYIRKGGTKDITTDVLGNYIKVLDDVVCSVNVQGNNS